MDKEKNRILDAWIMVEHLSEGDIKSSDIKKDLWNKLEEDNYYQLFKNELNKKKPDVKKEGGMVLYLNIFEFDEVINLLRKTYGLKPTEEEIPKNNKFSIALYFDKELKLNWEMTFFTASYYIKESGQFPREKEFDEFEERSKENIKEMFTPDTEEINYEPFFNSAFKELIKKYKVNLEVSGIKILDNLERGATNLHSFFIKDLEKAKKINANNLTTYLLGKPIKRIDLDSRKESNKFNPLAIQNILNPINYPVSRFPSNPKYSLSLMQQVAVNLAIGYDNETIRSVNGPPGTGKTTLLKDIFAELIVEQALEISKLTNKTIVGTEEITYDNGNKGSIGNLPVSISEKGIVVMSSNNSAVQNIVNELPLLSGIDDSFKEDILKTDYFKDIMNSLSSSKEDKNSHEKNKDEENKFWGAFSLEGGRKDNMKKIITLFKGIYEYFGNNEYKDNQAIYKEFMQEYEEVSLVKKNIEKKIEKKAKSFDDMVKLNEEIKRREITFYEKINKKETNNVDKISQLIVSIENEIEKYDESLQSIISEGSKINNDKKRVEQLIETIKLQKPGFLASPKKKKEYNNNIGEYSKQMILILEAEAENEKNKIEVENKKQENEKLKVKHKKEIHDLLLEQSNWEEKEKNEINNLKNNYEHKRKELYDNLEDNNNLDMNLDYEKLQLSNPWFDEDYRIKQSKLFISALKVRKQFLYENRNNIKSVEFIWNNQNKYKEDKKIVIAQAWNWINMVVPVISSTFASVKTMFKNLDSEVIGHLFIDEAGQALPQASVGAIFRSKNVMAVGDPAQIKPVLTLDSSILSMIANKFEITSKYLSDTASTQTLIDSISQYGFYKDNDQEEWIGIPLWVHRRCQYPMFDISNAISYGGNMVQGVPNNGKANWYDSKGKAVNKYVKEQGECLKNKLLEMKNENPDKQEKEVVYVISPFKNVAEKLSQELKAIENELSNNGIETKVGTVHTFQGMEANTVFLVLGADETSTGAASWAVGSENPNIMNVAATRAKKEFYIIGDRELYTRLGSEVIKKTVKIIDDFNSKD